jgi:hypothetical protein
MEVLIDMRPFFHHNASILEANHKPEKLWDSTFPYYFPRAFTNFECLR